MKRNLETVIELLEGPALHEIYRHARDVYPAECCGMILRRGVRRCENIQDRLHREDPLLFPRSSRNGFTFDAEDQFFLARSMENGDPILAVYHSHPDESAYFSRADEEGVSIDGTPFYPEFLHLVVACSVDRIVDAALFEYRAGDFREAARFEGAPI